MSFGQKRRNSRRYIERIIGGSVPIVPRSRVLFNRVIRKYTYIVINSTFDVPRVFLIDYYYSHYSGYFSIFLYFFFFSIFTTDLIIRTAVRNVTSYTQMRTPSAAILFSRLFLLFFFFFRKRVVNARPLLVSRNNKKLFDFVLYTRFDNNNSITIIIILYETINTRADDWLMSFAWKL